MKKLLLTITLALGLALILAVPVMAAAMETPTGSSGSGTSEYEDGGWGPSGSSVPVTPDESELTAPDNGSDYALDENLYSTYGSSRLYACGTNTINLSNGEYALMSKVNNYRAQHGKVRLCVHAKLMRAARYWSDYMRDTYSFGHGCLGCRMNYFGYGVEGQREVHENLHYNGADSGSIQLAFDSWKGSNSHNAAMLDTSIREMGVGIKHNDPHDVNFYTLDLGRR